MAEIIMAFAPLVFLIVYALKTRKMADAMILATLLAMVLLHRQHFLTGTIDALYGALSNSSYQFVLCIIIGFGGMITLFQESGALMGFRDLLLKAGAFPKARVLKRAYRRVESGGPAFERDEKAEKLVDVADVNESRASSAWNAVPPLAVLVGGHGICRRRLLGDDDHRHPRVRAAGPVHGRDGARHHRRRHERYRSGIQHLLLRRRSVYDHSGHRRVQHYHHQGHAALCRRCCGGGCGGVSAVRDTGVREPAGRFRREAPLHILYGALTWRAAGDML